MNDRADSRIRCHICSQPVDLTADTAADEDGQTVHERCYVKKLTASRDKTNPKSVKSRAAKASKLRRKSASRARKRGTAKDGRNSRPGKR
jgi:hypothetical protein